MKKILVLAMVCVLAFGLVACGGIPQEKKDELEEKLSNLESLYEQVVEDVDAARAAGAEFPESMNSSLDMMKEGLAPARELVDDNYAGVNEAGVDEIIDALDMVTPTLEGLVEETAGWEALAQENAAAEEIGMQVLEQSTIMGEKFAELGEIIGASDSVPDGVLEEFMALGEEIGAFGQEMMSSDGSVEQTEEFLARINGYIEQIDALAAQVA